jgi:paraquat-inducible protein B
MASRANYVKIGLFVILGLLAMLAVGVGLGALAAHRDTVAVYTFFKESVQGLDVGAPVTFRGVRVATAGYIGIAPDRRTVEVRMDVDVHSLERLGVFPKGAFKSGRPIPRPPPDLRAQLQSQGLTGVRYVSLDFFDPQSHPPPELSFPVPENYVPAEKSFSKSLEDSVAGAMERVTKLADASLVAVDRIDGILGVLERGNAGEQTVVTLRSAAVAMRELDATIGDLHRAHLAEGAGAALGSLQRTIEKVTSVLDRLDGAAGLIATTQRSVAAFGDVGRNATGASQDLEETFAEIREAATAVRLLADELERQPDALLKGRAAAGGARR